MKLKKSQEALLRTLQMSIKIRELLQERELHEQEHKNENY